jgi:hypothetical protein
LRPDQAFGFARTAELALQNLLVTHAWAHVSAVLVEWPGIGAGSHPIKQSAYMCMQRRKWKHCHSCAETWPWKLLTRLVYLLVCHIWCVCSDAAIEKTDRATHHRLLLEHFCRQLLRGLEATQTALQAAERALGRSVGTASRHTQTKASDIRSGIAEVAGGPAPGAAVGVPENVAEGAAQGAAVMGGAPENVGDVVLRPQWNRDVAFRKIFVALHSLPRRVLMLLPHEVLGLLTAEVGPTILAAQI